MTQIKWIAHATFEILTEDHVTLIIDPWYSDSPVTHAEPPKHVDFVLVTHDHWDHVKDVSRIAKLGAKVMMQPETGARFIAEEGINESQILRMNVGGTAHLADGLAVTMIPAIHSSRTGLAVGYILHTGNTTIAHLGDTALFQDLHNYGLLYPVDIALVPIGGYFTMDNKMAAKAVGLLEPKIAVPMHYGTFPLLTQSPDAFAQLVEDENPGIDVWTPSPGESRAF